MGYDLGASSQKQGARSKEQGAKSQEPGARSKEHGERNQQAEELTCGGRRLQRPWRRGFQQLSGERK